MTKATTGPATCSRCGRKLKRYVKIGNGTFGLYCAKRAGAGGSEKGGEPRSDYRVEHVTDEVVFLRDLDRGGRSVTNDAEKVVGEIVAEHGPNRRIVYCDSMGLWTELVHQDGRFREQYLPWRGEIPVHVA